MTATLDRLSDGRLLINVVTGGDPVENKGDGIFLDHAERYEVTDEFLRHLARAAAGETVDFTGKHLPVEGGKLLFPPRADSRIRRSISAARPAPASRSPPSTSTST